MDDRVGIGVGARAAPGREGAYADGAHTPVLRGRPRCPDRRHAMVEAAGELFMARGFAGTSMDEVARRAGVSKQTVYSHFESKERLYAACIRTVCETYFPDAINLAPDADIATRLTLIGRHLMALLMSEPAIAMYRMLVARAGEGPKMAELFYEAGPAVMKKEVGAVLGKAVGRGELRSCDTERASAHFAALIKGEYHFKNTLGLRTDLDERAIDRHVEECVDLFLAAYGSEGATRASSGLSRSDAK